MDASKKRLEERLNAIDSYWDKKTLFVHRRALLTGYFLGIISGICVGIGFVFLFYK